MLNSLTISEIDRQRSDGFASNTSCLIATALKRRGIKNPTVTPWGVRVDGIEYDISPYAGCINLADKGRLASAPFYYKRVVGKKFTFKKVKN